MIFDIIAIAITVLLLLRGLKKGAVNTVFDLTKILLSIFLIPTTYKILEKYLNKHNILISYLVCFIIILIVLSIIVYLIKSFINIINLGFVDNIVGAIIGFIESIFINIIILVILLFVKDYSDNAKNILSTSYVAYYLSLSTSRFNEFFPKKIYEKLDEFYFENKKTEVKQDVINKIKEEINNNED